MYPIAHIPDVDHVLDGVYIGGVRRAALHIPELYDAGITHVLKLYASLPHWPWPDDFVVCDLPIEDEMCVEKEKLHYGVSFIKSCVAADQPVLVTCEMGISRSATLVLAYLVERGYNLHDAWRLLRARHCRSGPAGALWCSLLECYQLNYSMDDIWDWYHEC